MSEALLDLMARRVSAQMGLAIDASHHAALRNVIDVRGDAWRWIEAPLEREDIELLARGLSVGETYFFREPAAFQALEHDVLPPLIEARRRAGRRLRLWSAGCCTGEEAYSLVIMLARLLPDLDDWDVRIVGTDIHPGFLERAREGVYGDWSFRGVPADLRERYFECRGPDRHELRAELKRRVEFRFGNLACDAPPDRDFDIILCRHVLMYFVPAQAERAVQRVCEALAPGGWLVLSCAEAAVAPHGLDRAPVRDMLFHRRPLPPAPPQPAQIDTAPHGRRAAQRALRGCEAALAADRCNVSLHWLHATLLEAIGEIQGARDALRRALFLDADFLPAHMALARLGERQGDERLRRRHLAQAQRLLDSRRHPALPA
ncbi:CheR family methyltransferase [Piscinibacter sp. XHJ-5]|uniref:CheR family methyltransferase n=1 Tax=Piscinibacter sp. XHJ-5 TaxID=3037797 RepID=UPI002452D659|nr:CheR family methyltransferase [Piscinibacter sp. XHJ-5]